MRPLFSEHRAFWTREHRRSLYVGLLLLFISLFIEVVAGRYSARRALDASFVNDLILDNLAAVNLDFIIVEGAIVFWVAVSVLLFSRPRYLLFGLKAIALFIITRSFFISLTHIGLYPDQIEFGVTDIGYRFYGLFTFQGNFFFSGHTGLPFLLSLVFWDNMPWRKFFLAVAIVFGVSVLLAHVHYSIDVSAAPFITYGIFKVTQKLFPSDYALRTV